MRRGDSRIFDEDARFLYGWYLAGYSVAVIADAVWVSYEYANPRACETSIYRTFKKLSLAIWQHDFRQKRPR